VAEVALVCRLALEHREAAVSRRFLSPGPFDQLETSTPPYALPIGIELSLTGQLGDAQYGMGEMS
jgi:hypothetical protein